MNTPKKPIAKTKAKAKVAKGKTLPPSQMQSKMITSAVVLFTVLSIFFAVLVLYRYNA